MTTDIDQRDVDQLLFELELSAQNPSVVPHDALADRMRCACKSITDLRAKLATVEARSEESIQLKARVAELEACLEPGKASAIVNRMFREAQRLGFYKPTGKHALTQIIEEIENNRARLVRYESALKEAQAGLGGLTNYHSNLLGHVPMWINAARALATINKALGEVKS